ncbi:MAG: CPBP family intramembrane metalloprotease [Planctomycetaceae bacterium]|nr:CPBP family intramembrane metalloprotease [Planctomycetales bacterium]MCB9873767.1 CPBP family intramembrane metalloprotease [Planctomycetaceae bacterium]MCB9939742.1 CPBP family intramembrane metalloprotease [Planctomycetaceae bacterium]
MTAFSFEAALGVAALMVGWLVGVDPLSTIPVLAKDSSSEYLLAVLWGTAATIPLLIGLWFINRLAFRPLVRIRRFVTSRVLPLFEPLSLLELAAVSLAAGFGEELLFRGLCQAAIAERISGPTGIVFAIALTSVLFGVCHWITPAYAVLAAVASIYFGVLFLMTGSLLAPLVTHSLYDFLALVYLTRWSKSKPL